MKNTELATLITIISGILLIIGYATGAFRWVKNIFAALRHHLNPAYHYIPKKTIVVLPHIREAWWHLGGIKNQPAMQVVGYCHVTNITSDSIELLNARIIRPRNARFYGSILVTEPGSNIASKHSLPSKATAEVNFNFWIQPPVCDIEKNFKATIAIIDKYGNEHKIKNIIFKYR